MVGGIYYDVRGRTPSGERLNSWLQASRMGLEGQGDD